MHVDPHPVITPLVVFGRLVERGLGALEALGVSERTPDGLDYLDVPVALARTLGEGAGPASGGGVLASPATRDLHAACYAAWPDRPAAVSGVALHLRDLLALDLPLPEPTSMMRKRGVVRVADHVIPAGALWGPERAATLARARALADERKMTHVLLIEPDGMVHVAGRGLEETMAHWSNVEFSARIECLRLEDRLVRAQAG